MKVGFSGLKIHCSIGILPHEKIKTQDILVSLKIQLSTVPATSDISSTIDYSALAEICETHAMLSHYELMETLASTLLDKVFSRFSCAYGWIRIEKPAAIAAAQCAFVEYERGV